jgi:hypothetical protein
MGYIFTKEITRNRKRPKKIFINSIIPYIIKIELYFN